MAVHRPRDMKKADDEPPWQVSWSSGVVFPSC